MTDESVSTTILLKAVQFAAVKHQTQRRKGVDDAPALSRRAKAIKLADKIANMRDVIDNPPTDWPLARRIEYLNWTERVVAGCRGTNDALERHYDEVLEKGRATLARLA